MSSLSQVGLCIVPGDLFDVSSTKQATLGAYASTNDGRIFAYAQAGASALVAGTLLQSSAEDTNTQNLTPTATAIGATSITTSSTVTVTANEYADGWAVVTVTPGVGLQYKISGHTAETASAVALNLSDKVQVALTTTSRIDLVRNPFAKVIINPTTATSAPVGVAVVAIPATYYGWVQVSGVATILANGAITVGTSVVASNAVAGAVEPGADATDLQAFVGTAVTGIADTQYGAISLSII